MNTHLPAPVAEFWAWQLFAACRGMDVSMFFSPPGERGSIRREREERARAVCRGCPVRDACARFALSTGQHYGVWGGLSEGERHERMTTDRGLPVVAVRRGPRPA
ncbi:WhiB family transcriptional regulator [Streptomyces sp. NPDC001795]|uniref:WhiB family transcriptional regulator n=1 Tax=unclassified Streptomyces TaxID=2593676 RepID=UPI0033220907